MYINTERAKAYRRKYQVKHSERAKRNDRIKQLKKYGLTLESYDSLHKMQEGRCALCKRHETEVSKRGYRLSVDHCHETGKVRGLVCCRCNLILEHGIKFFKRGVEYFESSPVGVNGEHIGPEITRQFVHLYV